MSVADISTHYTRVAAQQAIHGDDQGIHDGHQSLRLLLFLGLLVLLRLFLRNRSIEYQPHRLLQNSNSIARENRAF
jgi:hypothetical protein